MGVKLNNMQKLANKTIRESYHPKYRSSSKPSSKRKKNVLAGKTMTGAVSYVVVTFITVLVISTIAAFVLPVIKVLAIIIAVLAALALIVCLVMFIIVEKMDYDLIKRMDELQNEIDTSTDSKKVKESLDSFISLIDLYLQENESKLQKIGTSKQELEERKEYLIDNYNELIEQSKNRS